MLTNWTMNITNYTNAVSFQTRFGWMHFWVTVCLLGALILCTIVGNVFVVAAILLEKHLQGVSNYLILSLAVADLMVATLPMPISAINEVSEDWWLGNALCDFWVCSDVLCCTASILHLVGIALDRYWAVTNAEYIRKRTAKRIGFMITVFWLLSIAISLPARFNVTRLTTWLPHLGTDNSSSDEFTTLNCGINKEYGYTIFSTVGAFYMPMIFMICIYARIYLVAKARIRRSTFRKRTTSPTECTGGGQAQKCFKSCDTTKLSWMKCFICYRRPLRTATEKWPRINASKCSDEFTRAISLQTPTISDLTEKKSGNETHRMKTVGSFQRCSCTWVQDPEAYSEKETIKENACLSPTSENEYKVFPEVASFNEAEAIIPDRTNRDRNASFDVTQCTKCWEQFILEPVMESRKVHPLWDGISHSAPPSVLRTPKPSYSSLSSSLDSSCYTANRSEKSDLVAWSSSCSVEHRNKRKRNREDSTTKFYTVMKTFIIHNQKASHASTNNGDNGFHLKRLRRPQWLIHKMVYNQPNRANIKTNSGISIRRRLSQSCCDTFFANEGVQIGKVKLPIDCNAESLLTNGVYDSQSFGRLEVDDASGGTLHLEARLKSTVSEVTKLATVTAMVKRERLENQRERKAVITLAIITGCFMLCWLPFFIVALIAPFYEEMKMSKVGQGIVLWLGYSNSLLNPIIYTIFSPDFRNAFRKILFGRYYLRYRDR